MEAILRKIETLEEQVNRQEAKLREQEAKLRQQGAELCFLKKIIKSCSKCTTAMAKRHPDIVSPPCGPPSPRVGGKRPPVSPSSESSGPITPLPGTCGPPSSATLSPGSNTSISPPSPPSDTCGSTSLGVCGPFFPPSPHSGTCWPPTSPPASPTPLGNEGPPASPIPGGNELASQVLEDTYGVLSKNKCGNCLKSFTSRGFNRHKKLCDEKRSKCTITANFFCKKAIYRTHHQIWEFE